MRNPTPHESGPLPTIDEEPAPSPIVRGAHWLEDRWPNILTLLGGLGLAGYQLADTDEWLVVFLLFGAVFMIGTVASFGQTPRITKLERKIRSLKARLKESDEAHADLAENAQIANRQIIDPQIETLAGELNFGDTERISVYKNAGSIFSMIGRYSENPGYNRQGRRSYPENEGCIGQAYFNGSAFDDNMPDARADLDRYCEYMAQRWQIDLEVCQNFAMKPRNIVALALYESVHRRRIGVIVFESTRVGRLTIPAMQEALHSPEGEAVAELAEKLQAFKTSIRQAIAEEL